MTERASDMQALGRVEGKMDMVLEMITQLKQEVCDNRERDNVRIALLERFRDRSTGYMAGAAAAILALWELGKNLLL